MEKMNAVSFCLIYKHVGQIPRNNIRNLHY